MKTPLTILMLALASFALAAEQRASQPASAHHDGARLEIKSIRPASPAKLAAGEKLTIVVEYRNPGARSVHIWARPYTKGNPTSGYRAHPSPSYKNVSGKAEGWFFFDRPTVVDEIRVQMVEMANSADERIVASITLPIEAVWEGERNSSGSASSAPASAGKPTPAANSPGAERKSGTLPWESDYVTALAKARAEKRPIFLMLTATWCGPCKMLESQTLPDPIIRSGLKEFVWVKTYEDKEL